MEPDNRPPLNWTEKQALKDDLFERAKYGKITGAEADAEAVRLGLGSLSKCPAPDAFRPEAEAQWTLPMAVAWIAYLDLEEVREWSAPYCDECWDWHWKRWRVGFDGPVHEGWHLEQRSAPTLALLGISDSVDGAEGAPPQMTIREAQDALWIALREDFFRATGIDTETGRRAVIPPLDWQELVSVQGQGKTDEVRRRPLGSGYSDLLLPSAALQGYWRKPVESTATLPPTIKPEGDGFMPLYCAAQWIATEGDTIQFPPEDQARWRFAYDALLAAITSNKVRVVGMRGGVSDKIEGHVFAGIRVDYPFHGADFELRSGKELYLRSYAYLDEEHWRSGFDDALVWRVEDRWTRIMVDKRDVRALWPLPSAKPSIAANALPLSMAPDGDGYMPLYCAAEWIATKGGLVDFEVAEEKNWPEAFNALLSAIASEKVRVTGMRGRLREPVPAAVFADLPVFYPSGNADDSFLGTGQTYLQSWVYQEEHWREGYSDKITSDFETQWTALMAEKGDVRRLWPFGETLPPRSGTPGRPTSSHLFRAEMERRGNGGELEPSLAAEARYLSQWLKDHHPAMPQALPGSIEEVIRSRYWTLRRRK